MAINIPSSSSSLSSAPIRPQPDAPIVQMPDDILFTQIFPRLLGQEIGPLTLVCRQWCRLFEQDNTLRLIFRFQFPSVDEQGIENFKKFYHLYSNVANGVSSLIAFQKYEGLEDEQYLYDYEICSIALAGQRLFSCSNEKAIKVWDIKAEKCIATFQGHTDSVNSLAVAGQKLISGSDDGTIRVWDIEKGKCIAIFRGDEDYDVFCLAVAGQTLFAGTADWTIMAFDIETGSCMATFAGHEDKVYSLALDGQTLFSGSRDNIIKAWDIKTGKCIATFKGHKESVISLAVAGQTLFSGSSNNEIRAWNIKTGECIAIFEGHKFQVESLALVGPILFSASSDNTIMVWNIETGKSINSFQGYEHPDVACSLAVAGQTLFLGSTMDTETTIYSWNFTADHSTIFQQIAQLLETGSPEVIQKTLERLSKMPIRAKKKIGAILDGILGEVREPTINAMSARAKEPEVIFDDKSKFRVATPGQIAQAIHKYLPNPSFRHASSSGLSANGKRTHDTAFETDRSTKQ